MKTFGMMKIFGTGSENLRRRYYGEFKYFIPQSIFNIFLLFFGPRILPRRDLSFGGIKMTLFEY